MIGKSPALALSAQLPSRRDKHAHAIIAMPKRKPVRDTSYHRRAGALTASEAATLKKIEDKTKFYLLLSPVKDGWWSRAYQHMVTSRLQDKAKMRKGAPSPF